jgi:phospholipid-binding lipoprotein MlaA
MMNLRPLRLVFSDMLVVLALLVSGCATGPDKTEQGSSGEDEFNDPFEDTNRKIFEFNQFVDRNALVPVAKAYRAVVPDPLRDSVRDFLYNLRAPLIFANDALQGNFNRAGETLARFAINSTIGMAGFVDVAGRWGIRHHEQDLGVTFGVWGIPEGPYIIIPVLGPSNPRDLVGQVGESFGDPWNILAADHHYVWVTFVRGGVSGIDQRSRYIETLADIERTSLDYYATIRSLYRQRRAALIRGDQKDLPPNPGFTEKRGPGSSPISVAGSWSGVVGSQVANLPRVSW